MDSGSSSSGSSSGSSGCNSLSDASTIDAGDWGESSDGSSWSPVCPEMQPSTGTTCSGAAVGVSCEYGAAWWSIGCNTVLWCNAQDEAWTNSNPSALGCLPQPGPNCASCPINPTGLSGACSNPGVSCYYGEGPSRTCSATDTTWSCYPPPGCPSVRPRLGAPCVTGPSGGCRYNCYEGMICSNGIWQYDTFGDSAREVSSKCIRRCACGFCCCVPHGRALVGLRDNKPLWRHVHGPRLPDVHLRQRSGSAASGIGTNLLAGFRVGAVDEQ